ncbi:hypothetical protein, partial [Candidatus Accumulibacter phosphatis]|uniref:hypothetical protein n=1 Tax=Candidatus Accumulibacter phosphatis TaxID=327160 RepID=UPI001B7DAAC3
HVETPRIMKVMTVTLFPCPFSRKGEGRFVSRLRDFHINALPPGDGSVLARGILSPAKGVLAELAG